MVATALWPSNLRSVGDLHLQVVLLHYQPGPDERQQVVLRDQLAGSLDEHDQQVERTRAERDRLPVLEQAPLGGLQLEAAETVGATRLGSCGSVGQTRLRELMAEVYPAASAYRQWRSK